MEKESPEILRMIYEQNQILICAVNLNNQYQAEILKNLKRLLEKTERCEVHLYKVQRDIKWSDHNE